MTPVERCPVCDKPAGPGHPWAVGLGYVVGLVISAAITVTVVAVVIRVAAWAVRGVVG